MASASVVRSGFVAVGRVVELEVVLGQESKLTWAGVFEPAHPIAFLCEPVESVTALGTQMPVLDGVKISYDFVDIEGLGVSEFIQLLIVHQQSWVKRLR